MSYKDGILASDPNLVYFPTLYMHGNANFSLSVDDLAALRYHLDPGGGTLFADAACGSATFDAAFRRFTVALLPNNPLVPIPSKDELYSPKVGSDLSQVQFTKAAGGGKGFPQLEGVQINGHWAIIYSRFGIGFAPGIGPCGGMQGVHASRCREHRW